MTKGIIQGKIVGTSKYSVRIPYLESAGSGLSILEATLCTNPSMKEEYKEGDVVFVDFEDGEWGKPVILGALALNDALNEPRGYINSESLNVTSWVALPSNTSIGGYSLPDLKMLVETLQDAIGGLGKGQDSAASVAITTGDSVVVDCDGADKVS